MLLLYCLAGRAGAGQIHPARTESPVQPMVILDSSEPLYELEGYEGERGTLWSSDKRRGAAGRRVRRQNAYATLKHRED